MLSRLSLFCLLLFMVPLALIGGQRPISLDDAIAIALKQNQGVAIARYGIQKAEAQAKEALGSALPTVSVSANYQRNIQAPVFFVPNFSDPSSGTLMPVRFGLNNAYSAGASFNQVLFNSAVFGGIGAADVYVQAAREQYRATVAEVVTETKKRYYGTLVAREFMRIAQATFDNAVANKKNIDVLFSEGLVAEYDAIRVNVFVENIRPQLTSAQAGYRNAVSALMTYLAVELSDTLNPETIVLEKPGTLPEADVAVEMALRSNYELQALAKSLDVTDRLVNIYRSSYYPTLSMFGQYQNSGQSDNLSTWVSASQFFVGLSFNVNLFTGFRVQAQVEQAQADYESARERYNQLKNMIRLQVTATLNDLASAKERIEAQVSTVDQAQRGFEIAQVRYKEGVGSLLEINDAQTALSQAQVNQQSALFDFYIRLADFERATGQVPDKYMRLAAL